MWYRGGYHDEPGIQAAFGAGAALYDQQPDAPAEAKYALAERLLLVFPEAKPSLMYGAVTLGFLRARGLARR